MKFTELKLLKLKNKLVVLARP